MSEREQLLRAVLSDPHEDTVRLAFADWLDENGEERRAAFIRDTRGNWPFVHGMWEEVAAAIPPATVSGFGKEADGDGSRPYWSFNLPGLGFGIGRFLFDRGFVSEIHLPCDVFMQHAEGIFRAHPVTNVVLTDWVHASYDYHNDTDRYRVRTEMLPAELVDGAPTTSESLAHLESQLSLKCVAYGRKLAELPALTPVEAR